MVRGDCVHGRAQIVRQTEIPGEMIEGAEWQNAQHDFRSRDR